jgi:hypothetical protein
MALQFDRNHRREVFGIVEQLLIGPSRCEFAGPRRERPEFRRWLLLSVPTDRGRFRIESGDARQGLCQPFRYALAGRTARYQPALIKRSSRGYLRRRDTNFIRQKLTFPSDMERSILHQLASSPDSQ